MAAIHVMMFLGLAAWHMESVAGECCGSYLFYSKACVGHVFKVAIGYDSTTHLTWDLCEDCTAPTPYCGYGPCNVFGCNCDDGCRSGPGTCYCTGNHCVRGNTIIGKREVGTSEVASVKATDIIKMADKDQDGRLSYEEAHAYLGLEGNRTRRDVELQELDLNNDGFFTADEIDRDD